MAKLGRALRAEGIDITDLVWVNRIDTPQHIKDAPKTLMIITATTHQCRYLDLRQAVCDKLKRDNGLDYTPEQNYKYRCQTKYCNAVLVLLILAMSDLPTPYWVTYSEIVRLYRRSKAGKHFFKE